MSTVDPEDFGLQSGAVSAQNAAVLAAKVCTDSLHLGLFRA